ncbi:MAG TPA: molybdopterin molybdotransferase MoeA, partial [Sphingomicrobium sp.]
GDRPLDGARQHSRVDQDRRQVGQLAGAMISFDEATALIASEAQPLATETLGLVRAAGRVLARAIAARIDSPRSDVATMDGYAVRDEDLLSVPATLHVIGLSAPGAGWTGNLARGTCVRVFTGAPIPAGADTVIMQELVRRVGDLALIDRHPGADPFIRRRGSDFNAGDELLATGRLLDPRALVAAAAADLAEVEVFRRPTIRILCTGDELAEPGCATSRVGAIPDSVSLGVAALAEQWGAECTGRIRLPDELAPMEASAAEATQGADVVVVTGGASVGEKDFARAMFEPRGLKLIFSKLSIKPGKPAWFGRAGSSFVVGLPGNPTSAMVTARLLLAPLLARLQGRPLEAALAWVPSTLGSALPACGDRETFHRGIVQDGRVEVLLDQDSGAQRVLAEANVLVRQMAHSPALSPGETVGTLAF